MLEHLRFGFGRKLRLVLQTEAAECGLACACDGGRATTATTPTCASLRTRHAISLKGATLAQLMKIAGALGLSDAAPCGWSMERSGASCRCLASCIGTSSTSWSCSACVATRWRSWTRRMALRTLTIDEASRSVHGRCAGARPRHVDFKPRKERQRLPTRCAVRPRCADCGRPLAQVFALAADAGSLRRCWLPFFSAMGHRRGAGDGRRDLLAVLIAGLILVGGPDSGGLRCVHGS